MSASSDQPSNILIFGATGVIGKYITSAILDARAKFNRVAIFTSAKTVAEKPEEIAGFEARGAEIIVGSVSEEADVKKAYSGIDTVVSCLGRNAIRAQIPLIDWAAQCMPRATTTSAGGATSGTVRRFVPSEYGTDIEYSPDTSPSEPPHQHKLAVRAHMKAVVAATGLEYTYLVTGPYSDLFLGNFKALPQVGSFDVVNREAVLLGTGEEKISFTTMGDVGKLLVAALLHPSASRNATLIVNSFTATGHEILREYERQTASPWTVSYTSLSELCQMESAAYAQNSPLAVAHTLRRIWLQGGTLYSYRDNAKLGFADADAETLQQQITKIVQKQTGDAS